MEFKDLIGGTITEKLADNCFTVSKNGKSYEVYFDDCFSSIEEQRTIDKNWDREIPPTKKSTGIDRI